MKYSKVREVFESFVNPQDSPEQKRGKAGEFTRFFRKDILGISQRGSKPCIAATVADGNEPYSPYDFNFTELSEMFLGHRDNAQALLEQALCQGNHLIYEANGTNAAITPGNIPNVSAFLGAVTGLLDAQIIAGYNTPEFIIDQLIATSPSKVRQRALIGTGRIGDKAARRNPGEGHTMAQFTERKIMTQETYNDALGVAVTFEAVFFDQTGEVLDRAHSIGKELALRKELDGMRLIAGYNNFYNYNGASYNTYVTSGGFWVNKVTSNPLVDWTALNVVKAMFSRMTDQEQGQRIGVTPDVLLVSPLRETTAEMIMKSTGVQARNTAQTIIADAPALYSKYKILSSPIMDQVLTASAANGGMALSQSAADDYWWAIKTGKDGAFVRNENWGITVKQASPNDYISTNQRIVMAAFADQMHSFDVREPRYVIESTG